jgi:hypothetical protein
MDYVSGGPTYKLKVSGRVEPSKKQGLRELLWYAPFRLNDRAAEKHVESLEGGQTIELYPAPEDKKGCEEAGKKLERFGLKYEVVPK